MLAVAIHVVYTRQYFFLFDDFALVGQASTYSINDIVGKPLFGFYRPVVFLLIRAEAALFGWQHPAGYMAVSSGLHLLNAALVFVILRRFAVGAFGALFGAALFAASPWSSEAHLWLSGSFDVVSGFGTLVCLAAALTDTESRAGRAVLTLVALAGATVAILAKENVVVVLPLALVSGLAALGGTRRLLAAWPCWTGAIAVEGIYLVIRNRILPGLGGAYGSAGSLFRKDTLVANALGYVRAFVTVPVPSATPHAHGATAALALIVGALARAAALAWLANRRLTSVALPAFMAAIAPTLWIQPGWFATQAGRFMYLPGVCGCLIAGATVDVAARRGPAARIASTALAGAALAWALCSCTYQALWWSQSATLARSAIAQFRPLADSGVTKVFIPNLPFWFDEGPYVLKDYSFGYYFGRPSTLSVKARNVIIERTGTGSRFAGWLHEEDGRQAPLRPAADEAVLALTPILSGTPLLGAHPERLSVFSTLDAQHVSEATVSVTTPIAWRAESSEPRLFTVVPERGRGDGTVRLIPIGRSEPVDGVAEVIIRSDDLESTELTRVTVRVRMTAFPPGAPFGSVDVLAATVLSAGQRDTLTFEGWALDTFSLRRVYAEAAGADGRGVPLGEATRDGERPDVSKAFPTAHDLYRARWILNVDPTLIRSLPLPLSVQVFVENSAGMKSRIGLRTIR